MAHTSPPLTERAVTPQQDRLWAALLAATLLNLPLGSVYAFSVFLRPIELELHIPRSALSFVFGLATVGFTVGSVAAPLLYRLASAPVLILASALAASFGIILAASAQGMAQLLLGYGIVYGTGGGVAYILVQQGVNLLVRRRRGLINGYLVSLYPLGAMLATPAFHWSNEAFGYRTTMAGLAATILACGVLAAILSRLAGTRLTVPAGTRHAAPAPLGGTFLRLSLVFFLAAAAGLTVLSQAKEIITAYGGQAAFAIAATTGITAAIAAARVSGGYLVDRFPVPFVACGAHLLALAGAILLTLWPSPTAAVVALAMVGMGYGFMSGTTAAAVGVYWPPADFGRVAGRTYIAWCAAAVSLPVLAGYLFDLTQGYTTTIIIAGCGNLCGIAAALTLPRRGRRDGA